MAQIFWNWRFFQTISIYYPGFIGNHSLGLENCFSREKYQISHIDCTTSRSLWTLVGYFQGSWRYTSCHISDVWIFRTKRHISFDEPYGTHVALTMLVILVVTCTTYIITLPEACITLLVTRNLYCNIILHVRLTWVRTWQHTSVHY